MCNHYKPTNCTSVLLTKILLKYSCRTLVAREWWVVNLAEEEGDSVDIATLFNGIVEHSMMLWNRSALSL
jgi:hypothetical protein